MQQKFKEIRFRKENALEAHFDLIPFEDLLKKQPKDHSQFNFHRVSFYVIMFITDGNGKYNLNFKDYNFKKGTVFTTRKDNIHKFYKCAAKGYLLVFTNEFILNHSNKLDASKALMVFNEMLSSPKLQLAKKEYEEILTLINQTKTEHLSNNDEYSSVILSSLLQIIFTKLFRIKSKSNKLFKSNKSVSTFLEFQERVEKDCFQNRKVSYYADKMNLSSKTLNNATQSIVNKSAKAFINDVFLIHTKRLIVNSSEPLTTIAYEVGFDEPTNFFKHFKKYTGMSASEFRDKL